MYFRRLIVYSLNHLTLKSLKSAYKQKFITEDVSENPRLDDVEVEIPVEYGGKGRQMAQMIVMMSTLLATFPFTAAFTIPGGFKNDNPDAVMVMLISKAAFKAFAIFDSIAMTSFITAAVIVFWSSARRDTESFMDTLPFAIGLTWISLIAMAVAFVTGLFVVLQKTLWSRTSLCERQNMVEDNPFLFIVRLMKIFVRRQAQSLYRYIGLMCQSLRCRRDHPRSACLAV
ncbi:hypothetical protein V6N11_042508 [Hibiscus sabdariffa]|uniref:PGG domain-containing protein n=1 Tax=Hibiscus sabdariffa TaxID=183260 RepID=A0ABR2QWX1_9ROSI